MNSTSVSLLDRLKAARPDASDWNRLQGIYLPLIRRWLARVPGLGVEADDLREEVRWDAGTNDFSPSTCGRRRVRGRSGPCSRRRV